MLDNIKVRETHGDIELVLQKLEVLSSIKREADALRTTRKAIAKSLGGAGSKAERQSLVEKGKGVKEKLQELDMAHDTLEEELTELALEIPNWAHPAAPRGDSANVLRVHGEARDFNAAGFEPKDHIEIGRQLGIIDMEAGAKVSGQKFAVLRGGAALLEMAIVQWALSEVAKRGYEVVLPPDLVRTAVVEACGYQPRAEASQVYQIDKKPLSLAGTAEISLAGMFMDSIIERDKLPIRVSGFSHCFRVETGGLGRDTRGLYRLHQFSKVEMFALSDDESSAQLHDEMLEIQTELYAQLGLHFKVLEMPLNDLGSAAYRKFDIEAWMPGRADYGEISSTSDCTDYQSRRLHIRYRKQMNDNRYVHTINGTAAAIPRLLVSILENNQRADGSVAIPNVLVPYMGGRTELRTG